MRFIFLSIAIFFVCCVHAQTYSPVAVSGYNADVVAEAPSTDAVATTSMSMDLSNHVMFSTAFGAGVGLAGGLVNSGTVVSGTRTYQMDPYGGNNTLYLGAASTQALTVITPASYSKVSLMAFSTEGASTISVTLSFTDGTVTSYGNFALADWFNGAGAVYCCFGRCNRISSPPYTLDGYPNNPRFYPVDINLSCADRMRQLQTITIGHPAGTYAFIMAVSGVPYSITIAPSTTNVSCAGGNNGHAAVTVTGSGAPYTYSWNTAPVQFSSTANNLVAGNYTCTITDANGCVVTQSVTITQPTAVTATTSQTNPSCNGGTGTATVTPSGGTPGYTYSWSPTGGNADTATNLSSGNYTCTITDANGCIITKTFSLTQPSAVTATASMTAVSCAGGNNGSATIAPSGGTPGYTYAWSPSGGNAATASSLIAGNYTCTVTDTNGCTGTQSITVTEPQPLAVTLTTTGALCNGSCNGQVSTVTTGGTTPYGYNWSSGCATASCTNLCAGSYSVQITDNNGCTISDSTTVAEPAPLVVSATPVDAHCNQSDGSASASSIGGTGAAAYTWLPGNSTGSNLPNIPAGTYSVVATDANGCTDTAAFIVNNINGVSAALLSSVDITCFGGSDGTITISASSGTPGYTYTWLPASAGSDSTATNLAAGNYTVTVTDAAGCISSVTTTLTQPTALTLATSTSVPGVCAGGSIQLNAVPGGGTPGYTIGWMPGNLIGAAQSVVPSASGTYTAYLTDAAGCIDSSSVTVTVYPLPVAGIATEQTSGCVPLCVPFTDGTSIAPPASLASWQWSFGDGGHAVQQDSTYCYTTPGVYSVSLIAVSSDGCRDTVTMNNLVTVYANPVAAFSASPQPASIIDPVVTFTDASTNAVSWEWNFGDAAGSTSTLQNPLFAYADATCYTVKLVVTATGGCADSTTEQVCVDPDISLYVPNAFTPGGDGKNEVFIPIGNGIVSDWYQFMVFDRWGNLVFTTSDLSEGWNGKMHNDGRPCQEDVYVWKLVARDVMGKDYDRIGIVTLLR